MILEQYPYVDDFGVAHTDMIKHWTDDPTKTMLQLETDVMYDVAIDLYPCQFTYKEVDAPEIDVSEVDAPKDE